jgi:hypothetical protein
MNRSNYIANLSSYTKVRLNGPTQHTRNGQQCTIIRILPNPSERADNQWYDVRFDDGTIGRFLEEHLGRLDGSGENRAA